MMLDRLGFEKPPDNVRWHAPAAERNRAPILDVLRKVMPVPGTILEVGAGSGQHQVARLRGVAERRLHDFSLGGRNRSAPVRQRRREL